MKSIKQLPRIALVFVCVVLALYGCNDDPVGPNECEMFMEDVEELEDDLDDARDEFDDDASTENREALMEVIEDYLDLLEEGEDKDCSDLYEDEYDLSIEDAIEELEAELESLDIIDPSDPDAVANVLVIPGDEVNGTQPTGGTAAGAPVISNNSASASIVSGNTLYVPFIFETEADAGTGYGGCYVEVDGASFYWDIPASPNTTASGSLVIPVGVPANVGNGEFCLTYSIYDNNNRISNTLTTCVTIGPALACPGYIGGYDGLTIASYDLGETAGIVDVSYDMFSVPDRMDIFYNDQWVGGTGSNLTDNEFPPVSYPCYDGTEGYVSGYGTVQVNYNPNTSRTLTIYMSGCLGGGTAWDLSVSCPN
jgi:hypothetical protein